MKRTILVLLTLAMLAIGIATAVVSVQSPVQPSVIPSEQLKYSYTKLRIIPKSKHFTAKPGDELEFSVKIKNLDNKTVIIESKIDSPPFPSINVMDSSWIKVEPAKLTLRPSEEGRLKIRIIVPKDVEKGMYSAQITLTNETVQMPYAPYPAYPNSIYVSVFVQIPPSAIIYPKFISDKVEPGKTYTYNITIENTGNRTLTMNPELTTADFYIPREKVSYLTEDMVEIIAPKTISPHSKVTVRVKVTFPEDAVGHYHGRIDLNIDDPNLDEWLQKVELSFAIRVEPTKPFVKEFYVHNASRLNISVTAMNYDGSTSDIDLKIYSPSGLLNITPTKVMESIKVTLQSNEFIPVPYPKETTSGEYRVSSWTLTYTYSIEKPEDGKWKIKVLSACDCITIKIEKE